MAMAEAMSIHLMKSPVPLTTLTFLIFPAEVAHMETSEDESEDQGTEANGMSQSIMRPVGGV